MLRALKDAPVACRVLCFTEGEELEPEIRALGVPVEHVGVGHSRPARLGAIIGSLGRRPVDIVQSAHFHTNLYAAVAARLTGAVSIGAIRNDVRSEVSDTGLLGRGQVLLPQLLIANSRVGRDRAIDYGRSADRVHLVENAVDLRRFVPLPHPTIHGGDRTLRLLLVGRLVPQTRVDRFLRMVASAAQQLPGWTIEGRIAGDGPLRGELEALARTILPPSLSV
ncbi:MAG: glycosyltransferase, partial [Actinobacteria bacterium]|nr:glycosyltransferase [Actinomycetota bacterium]